MAHIRYLPCRSVSICKYYSTSVQDDIFFSRSKISSYNIYSAVFLWLTDIFGALNIADEHKRVIKLVRGFKIALGNAASTSIILDDSIVDS